MAGFTRRAFTRSMGFDAEDMARPLIGICNTYSELNNCHRNLKEIAEAVKRGVWQAGGFPRELFDETGRQTPVLANMRPAGKRQMEELHYAGGMFAVLQAPLGCDFDFWTGATPIEVEEQPKF